MRVVQEALHHRLERSLFKKRVDRGHRLIEH